MTDDDVFDAAGLEHISGDLAGEGSVLRPVDVLGTDADVAAGSGFNDGSESGERRADHDLNVVHVGGFGFDRLDEGAALAGILVHLPVSGDDDFTAHFLDPFLYILL